MPRLDKMFSLEVTPEQFIRNCSPTELQELDLLLQSPHVQMRMYGTHNADAKPPVPERKAVEGKVLKKYPEFPENLQNNI